MTTTANNTTTTIIISDTETFTDIKALHEDMKNNYQSFIRLENELNASGKKALVIAETYYRVVKLKRGKLEFQSNKFGGAVLHISGNITHAEKIGSKNDVCEYRIYIEGRENPLVLLACKRR